MFYCLERATALVAARDNVLIVDKMYKYLQFRQFCVEIPLLVVVQVYGEHGKFW